MREIKFRLRIGREIIGYERWHKGNGSTAYWEHLKIGEIVWHAAFLQATDKDLYTNLPDKNGKEIYEGDIVKNYWYNCNGNFIGKIWVVKYGKHSVQGLDYYSNDAEGFYFDAQHQEAEETYNIVNMPYDSDKGIEIIGNIYKNPELLKEKKSD